jgi:hypothetical protein
MQPAAQPNSPIRHRHVLYVSGFDPQGPARYHRLYTEEASKQCAVSGHRIEIGPRRRNGPHLDRWQLKSEVEGQTCETTYDFLRWDDIVRKNWSPGHASYLRLTIGATWRFFKTGVLWRIVKTSLPAFSVCFSPFVVALGVMVAALALVAMLILTWWISGFGVPLAIAAVAAGTGIAGLNRLSHHAESAWYMGWVMRSYWFTTRQARGETPELEARLDAHAQHLIGLLTDSSLDEILVVGHSSGAIMATSIVARASRLAPVLSTDNRLSLLTLGQCFPILSYQPQADKFRSEIAAVAKALPERWIDVTAPSDRCCAGLVDPMMAVRGLGISVENEAASYADAASPKVMSPQFPRLFPADTYAELRQNLFELHFQYLKASLIAGSYDYFAVTAGPQSLAVRFAHQPTELNYRALQCFGGPFPALQGK